MEEKTPSYLKKKKASVYANLDCADGGTVV